MNSMKQSEFIDLVIVFLSGAASWEQRQQLERELDAAPERRVLFKSIEENWQAETKDLPGTESGWIRVEKRLGFYRKRTFFPLNWIGYAAAVLVLLVVVNWHKKSDSKELMSAVSVEKPIDYEEIEALAAIRDSVLLPDGTLVRLNKGSRLRFRKQFDGPYREVFLSGEGFFEVAKRADQPFKLTVGNALVTVLGTAFNARESLQDSSVSVAVLEGKVQLADTSYKGNAALLTAGWMGVTERHGIRTNKTVAENHLSWLHNRLVFDNLPLEEVAEQLEHLYNVEIIVRSQSLNSLKLTADINRGNLKDVLSKIGYTLDVKYRFTSNEAFEIYR